MKKAPLVKTRGGYKSSLALFRAALDVLLNAVKSIGQHHQYQLARYCQPGQSRQH